MLRLPSTKIELSSRDLVWHTHRYQNRKLQHEQKARVADSTKQDHADTRDTLLLPYHFPLPPSDVVAGRGTNYEDSLISDEPVPRNSAAFWEDIVATASAPLLSTDHESHFVDEETSLGSLASFDDSNVLESTRLGEGDNSLSRIDADKSGDLHEPSSYQVEVDPVLQSRFSTDSLLSSENTKDPDVEEEHRESHKTEPAPIPGSRRRLSFLRFHRRGRHGSTEEEISHVQRQISSHLDLDGSTDAVSRRTAQIPESISSDSMVDTDDQLVLPHRTRRGRRTDSSTFEIDTNASIGAESQRTSSMKSEPDHLSVPSNELQAQLFEHTRSRSGGLPRSRLYISQAAASSSPEKHFRSTNGSTRNDNAAESSHFVRPSNRPTKYKQRSQTYSFDDSVTSQEEPAAKHSSGVGNNAVRQFSVQDNTFSVSSSYLDESDSYSLHSSPPPNVPGISSPSIDLLQRSPAYSLSTDASPNHSTPPGEPILPLLPPPFSATPRQVSFNEVLPSSPVNRSATSRHLTLPFRPAPHSSSPDPLGEPANSFRTPLSPPSRAPAPAPFTAPRPRTRSHRRYVPSPSPPPSAASRRSLRVYNDSLPASSQPQTPIGLPRNGLPPMNSMIGAYTAPAGGRTERHRGVELETRDSPTRRQGRWRMRGRRRDEGSGSNEEQENLGIVTEAERRARERSEQRRRVPRDEELGPGHGGLEREGLVRTPPRGERRFFED